MTHGGGTVAGESPDRSEQRRSSGETASGGQDPRLAMFGESGSPVQVDQPTAVFKAVAPRTPEEDAPSADAVAPETPEPGEGDDARLKAAVAAWVATDEDEDGETAAESDGDAEVAADADAAAVGETADEATEAAEPEAEPVEPEAEPGAAVDARAAADAEVQDRAATATDEPETAEEPAEDAPEVEADVSATANAADGAGDDADDASEPETETATDADAEQAPASEAEAAPADPESAAESWFAAKKPVAAPQGAPEKAEEAEEPAQGASEAPKAPEAAEPAEKPAGDGVDQPTTMFKAVRPPVVDQPTTALKIVTPPAAPRPEPKAEPERPSTFVPLRKDDVPAPAPTPPAPPAAPRVSVPPPAPAPAASAVPPPASLSEAERTKQQPMPPLPPLDLLAELTNTPPPPPTPLRTTVRRVKIWTPLVLLLVIVFAVVQFVRPLPQPVLTLSVAPAFTFQGGRLDMPWPSEGQGAVEVEGVGSMGTYGDQKPAPLASVAKTMTAYVILRDHPLKGKQDGPEITIDKKAAAEAGNTHESRAPVRKGQEYSEKELLQLLMIPSANNVARLLARWDAGSEAAFVEKMNAAAKDLGMTESTYTDPSGLDSTTVSTPKDQLKLAKAVMQFDVFREIVNMPNVTVEGIPGRIENNNNILLEPGVSGIKTGSSTPAGGNLLWAANTVVDGKLRRVLGIVMGAQDAKILDDKLQLSIDYSLKLIQQAQKDVTSASVVREGQVVGYVDDGLGGRTPVVATKELKAIGWAGLKVDLELTDGGKVVPHSGKAGDIVGQISIGTGTGKVSAPVALKTDLAEPGIDKKLTRLG
ncbi:D-alanyl-D-alanine carboxypeptidase family protein [Streptomyces solicathayae]|uniref:Serine hydrolase n=1 Tax=Streptomyces solicathayae TaxID=3081768 RepID=A0ABZ0LWI0_9ACTN|nr:serine hydrolase [Streptomyces sp. HUAS YS2]WOX23827.1 serine hydrolase [Streptomyces sp. HUAS YS2]